MKNIINYLRYCLFIALMLFIIGELGLRIFKHETLVLNNYPKVYKFDTLIGYRGIPNKEGYIRKPSLKNKFKMNNHGFSGPDFAIGKSDCSLRIMVTGTSGIEGIWASHSESIPEKLNNLFKQNGWRIEVINCGISGQHVGFHTTNLSRILACKNNPDIILGEAQIPFISRNRCLDSYRGYSVEYFGSNFDECKHARAVAIEGVDRIIKHKVITDMFDISYSLRAIIKRKQRKPQKTIFYRCFDSYRMNQIKCRHYLIKQSFNMAESIKIYNDLSKDLMQDDCKLILFGYRENPNLMIFRDILDFSYISLNVPTGKEMGHKHDGHWNEKACNIVAEQLYNKLLMYFEHYSQYTKFEPQKMN